MIVALVGHTGLTTRLVRSWQGGPLLRSGAGEMNTTEEGLVQRLGWLLIRGLLCRRRHSQHGRSFFGEGCHLLTRVHLAMSGGCALLALTGGARVMGSSPPALMNASWFGPLLANVGG